MKKNIFYIILITISAFPSIVFAKDALDIISIISGLIGLATPIVVALALLFFFYGLARYILNAADEEKKSEGRNIMIWGIIALFVMVSVWGLTSILGETFGITNRVINIPFVR